jgi:hypothetical protein
MFNWEKRSYVPLPLIVLVVFVIFIYEHLLFGGSRRDTEGGENAATIAAQGEFVVVYRGDNGVVLKSVAGERLYAKICSDEQKMLIKGDKVSLVVKKGGSGRNPMCHLEKRRG